MQVVYWRGTKAAIMAPTRNRMRMQILRGFESHPLRQVRMCRHWAR